MNVYFSLLLNFLPFVMCFVAFKFIFRLKISTELFASLFGLLAVLPITFIQFYLLSFVPENLFRNQTDLTGLFCKVLVLNGLLEEGIKTVFLCFVPGKKLSLKSFMGAAVLSGMCLGCFESMVYFLQHLNSARQSGAELLYGMIFARMFSSDLIHSLCAGLCGLFVWSKRNKRTDLMPLIFAILAHGIFDFFVYFDMWIHWFAVAAVLFALMECRVHYVLLKGEDAEVAVTGAERSAPVVAEKKTRSTKSTKVSKSGNSTSKKKKETSSDETVVTSASKVVKKSDEKKPAARTKTRARKPKVEEEVIAEPDVTPEFNEEI